MNIAMPGQPMAPAGPVFNVGPLMNDIQLIALVAAHVNGPTPADSVALAIELIAEAVVQQAELNASVRRRQADRAE